MPAANLGSATPSGDYHCACDDFFMEDHFIDPGWNYHVSIAQLVGLATMRLADAGVVPLHYTPYASEVGKYLDELSGQQNDGFGREVVARGRDKVQAARWRRAALQARIDDRLSDNASSAVLDRLTKRLERAERLLLVERGLPGRRWYKHQIYAPGVNQGYGTQELPGINDALFLHNNISRAKGYEASLYRSLRAATAELRGRA